MKKGTNQTSKTYRIEQNSVSWVKRFKIMLNHYGLNLKDVAEITGNSYGSIRTVLNSENFPRWAKLAVVLFEKQNLKN